MSISRPKRRECHAHQCLLFLQTPNHGLNCAVFFRSGVEQCLFAEQKAPPFRIDYPPPAGVRPILFSRDSSGNIVFPAQLAGDTANLSIGAWVDSSEGANRLQYMSRFYREVRLCETTNNGGSSVSRPPVLKGSLLQYTSGAIRLFVSQRIRLEITWLLTTKCRRRSQCMSIQRGV